MEERKKHVLLVEDDDIIQKLISVLCGRRGILVTAIDSVQDIERAIADAAKYDLFLLDLILPEITGWDIAQKIRARPEAAGKPILILTGAVLSEQEKEKILQYSDAVVEKKSFSLPLFEELLNKYLP